MNTNIVDFLKFSIKVFSSTHFSIRVISTKLSGPLLFILYTVDIEWIAAQHGVDLHSYDDAQLYTSCSAANTSTSAVVLLCCINDVDICMSSNQLRLNAEKTQFIWISSSQMLAKTNKAPLRFGRVNIIPLDAVRDLGVVLNWNRTIKKHIDGIIRSCFHRLRQLWSIRRSLMFDAAHVLVHAFIHSSTGYQLSSGSHTRLQWWRSVVFVVRARCISPTSVCQFRQLPDVPSNALHTMVTSMFRLQNWRHLAVVASLCCAYCLEQFTN